MKRQTLKLCNILFSQSASFSELVQLAKDSAKNRSTAASTVSPCSFARSLRVILPAPEKGRSDSADDAGITKIFFANFDNC